MAQDVRRGARVRVAIVIGFGNAPIAVNVAPNSITRFVIREITIDSFLDDPTARHVADTPNALYRLRLVIRQADCEPFHTFSYYHWSVRASTERRDKRAPGQSP